MLTRLFLAALLPVTVLFSLAPPATAGDRENCTCIIDALADEDAPVGIKICNKVLKTKQSLKDRAVSLNCRALLSNQIKDYKGALRDANEAVAADKSSYEYITLRGQIYENLGQKEKAIADYRAGVSINAYDIEALNSLKRLGANANDPNEEWKVETLAAADNRKIAHPPSWRFQQWDNTHYLMSTDDLDPSVSCVVTVDGMKEEHQNKDAAYWGTIITADFMTRWCGDNQPGGTVKDTKLLKSQLVKANNTATPQCAWSLKRTAKDKKSVAQEYIMKWFIPLDTKLVTLNCSATSQSPEKIMTEAPVFAEEFIRVKDSIVP